MLAGLETPKTLECPETEAVLFDRVLRVERCQILFEGGRSIQDGDHGQTELRHRDKPRQPDNFVPRHGFSGRYLGK